MKKQSKKKEETVEDIIPFWVALDGWESLDYKTKCEYYWLYKYENGVRVYPVGSNE